MIKKGVCESFNAKKALDKRYIALCAAIEIPSRARVNPVRTVASQSKSFAPKKSLTIGILKTKRSALIGSVRYII